MNTYVSLAIAIVAEIIATSALKASEDLWRSAGLVDVHTRQFEVSRTFESFDDFWRSAHGSPRLRELFASLSPAELQHIKEDARGRIASAGDGSLAIMARANAVKGRTR